MSEKKGLRILVTGGIGYLGSHIAQYLLDLGHDVTITVHNERPALSFFTDKFRTVVTDIIDPKKTSDLARDMDVVIHTAGLNAIDSDKDDQVAIAINALGTRNLLDSAAKYEVRKFIYLSTMHVYGPPTTTIISEQTPTHPVNNYSITHLLAEHFCLKYQFLRKIDPVILRLSNGYGAPLFPEANCWMLAANDFCKRAVTDQKIILKSSGTQKRDFVNIKDICQAVRIITDSGQPIEQPIFNVGGMNSISIYDLARIVAEVYREEYKEDIPILFEDNVNPSGENIEFEYDISKLQALGYEPHSDMRIEISNLLRFIKDTSNAKN